MAGPHQRSIRVAREGSLKANSLNATNERKPFISYRASLSRNPYRFLTPEVERVIHRHFQWTVTEVPRVTRWVVDNNELC